MNTTELLRRQHRDVDALLKRLETGATSQDVRKLVVAVLAHALLEEESVYPLLRARREDLILGALEEHAVATYEVQRLLNGKPSEAAFRTKATILRQLIRRHVQEEEKLVLPLVEKALGRETSVFGVLLEKQFEEFATYDPDTLLARLAELDAYQPEVKLHVVGAVIPRESNLKLMTRVGG